jgi:hypothetical protein
MKNFDEYLIYFDPKCKRAATLWVDGMTTLFPENLLSFNEGVKKLQKEGELYLQETLQTEENLKYFEELGVKITNKL